MTSIGHSLLGDPTYGTPSQSQPKWLALPDSIRKCVNELPGQALHARVLGFTHPITGKKLRFEANPPPQFTHLLEALKPFKL
jgi:23S rRNA pseudouridine1911/1915/1917 synthase